MLPGRQREQVTTSYWVFLSGPVQEEKRERQQDYYWVHRRGLLIDAGLVWCINTGNVALYQSG